MNSMPKDGQIRFRSQLKTQKNSILISGLLCYMRLQIFLRKWDQLCLWLFQVCNFITFYDDITNNFTIDITSKAAIIAQNKAFYAEKYGEKHESIQEMIEKEMSLGVESLNGENNHKLLKKDKKDQWEWTYTSTGRTVLRNLWLLDFLSTLMTLLHSKREMTFSGCAKEAYNVGLGPHHPWAIR